MSALSLIVAMFVLLAVFMFAAYKQKIIVYKNKEQKLVLEEPGKGLLLNSMYVTKSGDIYIAGHNYADQNFKYVWKNGKVIANPKNYCFSLYVKE